MLNKIKASLGLCTTGFEPKIIISVGINANEYSQAKKEVEEIAKVIEIKLGDYLEQFPYTIKIK